MKKLVKRTKKIYASKIVQNGASQNTKPDFISLEYASEKRLLHPVPADWLAEVLAKTKKHIPVILQGLFLIVGGLLIIAFAFLIENKSQTPNYLLSPLSFKESAAPEIKKGYIYKLIWSDNKKLIFQEILPNEESLKLLNLGTNLTQTIISGKRNAFIGFTDNDNLLYLEDNNGTGQITVSQYNIFDKTTLGLFTFAGPKEISASDLAYLCAISPDKLKLAITHETGIVIYTLASEKDTTILENKNCESEDTCLVYSQPRWLSNKELLVNQQNKTTTTPLIVATNGNIQAVLPTNYFNIASSLKGLPLVGESEGGISIIDSKKTTLVLASSSELKYTNPVWLGENIIAFTNNSGIPVVIRIDKTGKKLSSVKEFTNPVVLSDLSADPLHENIYFLTTDKNDSYISVTFYKMGVKEDEPVSLYSISKNL